MKDGYFSNLKITKPHNYLVWYKENPNWGGKTNMSDLGFYKYMTTLQKMWIGWLFECLGCVEDIGLLFSYDKNSHERSSWMNFNLLNTNCHDWVKVFQYLGLVGVF